MDPLARQTENEKNDMLDLLDEDGMLGGYTKETLLATLEEADASGDSEMAWDTLIRDLNLQHFGRDRL